MAWIRQKQCLNCDEVYDIGDAICPHCNVVCKNIFQNKYGEQTIGYKLVDRRILSQKELEKTNRMKRKHIRYDERGFNPKTGLYRDGSRYNEKGIDIDGYDERGLDEGGYNRRGFNPETKLHKNGTYYDEKHLDIDGYNENGYDEQGHPRGRDPVKEQEKERARRRAIIEQLG